MDKNPRTNNRRTPLHSAANFGHLEICKLICNGIAEKNPITNSGQTPISLAQAKGYMDIVSFFENM